jgi:hypothetical protein
MKSKDEKVRGFRREGKAVLSAVPEAWVMSKSLTTTKIQL